MIHLSYNEGTGLWQAIDTRYPATDHRHLRFEAFEKQAVQEWLDSRGQNRWCIFHRVECGGKQVAWYDDKDMPVTYATEREAQLEILDDVKERIRQFEAGNEDREFDDIIWNEWIEPVTVLEDGTVVDEDGCSYGERK